MTLVSKNKKTQRTIFAVVLILLIGLAFWFYQNIDSQIVEEDKGYQGEAITNPYLAAEFFLRRMGQSAQQAQLFNSNPIKMNPDDTLLVPSVRLAFDSRRSETLLQWVEQGGHLIITGQSDVASESSSRDYILDNLGLYITRQPLQKNSTQAQVPVNVAIDDEDEFWQVDFDDYIHIAKTAGFNSQVIWSVIDEDRLHALQLRLGSGKLTVLSDMRLFRNDYIDQYDHAAFLFSLANDQRSQGQGVASGGGVFYYSLFEDQASLFQWLWQNAWPFMLSLTFLITIILWMLIPRFGPLINIEQPIRRQFLEHLKAAGNFHWRQEHYGCLLTGVRQQLSRQVKLKYPEWYSKSRQDQIMHFSDLSQLPPESIETALFDDDIKQAKEFVNNIKILEKLRRSL